MAELFGKLIPFETLAQMPLPFVHRLRDIRLKQLEERNKQREEIANRNNPQLKPGQPIQPTNPLVGVTDSDLEEFADELAGI